jgi:tetratricopeptide (TPR) repeat protein
VYPNERVSNVIQNELVAVRFRIKEQSTMWKRFHALWTPTILILEPSGWEQRRIEGFLPVNDFLGQVLIGLGRAAVAEKDWARAEQTFARALVECPETDAAAEALYWRGVSRYSASHDAKELQATARELEEKYPNTSWVKRASVWMPKEPGRAAA